MKAEVFDSIDAVPAAEWDALAATLSITQTTACWRVVEHSGLNDFRYRYAVFRDQDGTVAAVAGFYTITTDLAIFAPAPLRALLALIRQAFPNFLKVRMLECGTPVTLTSPPFAVRADVPTERAVAALDTLLLSLAGAEGHFLVVVRDFEVNAVDHEPLYRRRGYAWVDSLPNTYFDVRWTSYADYLKAMKSYYRSKVVKHARRNAEAEIWSEVVDDFDHLAEALCAQWLVVHHQADEFQREVLTPEFYRQFSRLLGADSKVILVYRGDDLVGHALLLLDRTLLRWLYFGRKEARNDSVYLHVGQKVIETAILLGVERIEMGLTTYSIKQDMGAWVEPIKMALRAPSRLVNPFIRLFYPLINTTPKPGERKVFKHIETTKRRGMAAG